VVRRLQVSARQQPGRPLAPVDLGAVIRDTMEITRSRWKDEPQRHGVVIDDEVALGDLPSVLGHAPEIREALTNLIFNAVDAMPCGGTLSISAREEVGAGDPTSGDRSGFVELTVRDTGIGMDEAVRRRIFDPFFTTKGAKGSGLGLSVVYGIMQRHGGHIEVASAPGQGTAVTLRFRVAAEEAGLCEKPAPVRTVPSRHLLLIDDDPTVRRTLAELLQAAGHLVTVTEGGAEGLTCLRQDSVDLVLTDLGMSEMSGWDVARAVKATAPHLPVILLTGWGEQPMGQSEHPGLVDRILGKPVRLNDLLTAIHELTARTAEPPAETA
jgi:CheY-like chemotaxis protein